MILDSYMNPTMFNEAATADLVASENYIGDACEFADISMTAMTEMHNLTLAMARVEHKCLMENDQSLMESAIGDFFKKKSILNGFIAQLVEQGTENPCVPGSIPGEATK